MIRTGEIRVVVVGSVRLIRDGLVTVLRGCEGVASVGAVDHTLGNIATIADPEPDVVLVDVAQSDMFALGRLIRSVTPKAKLVAFAVDEIDDQVFACAAAGFSGYVPRDSGPPELHRALRDAVEGRIHCPPHIAAAMFNCLARLLPAPPTSQTGAPVPSLTARERKILALVDEGLSNKEIARLLAISSSTVKNHMHIILRKLQVSRRAQAAAMLRERRVS